MRPRIDPSPDLMGLAAIQEHTLSRAQCLAHGLTDEALRRLTHSWWQAMAPGVYATHHLAPSWKARAWTGIHLGGATARVGGLAAAHLHGFAPEPELIQLWIDKTRLAPRPGLFFRHDGIGRRPTKGDLPLTTVPDTVLDICQGEEVDGVMGFVAAACTNTSATVDEIRRRLDERPLLRQVKVIRECLDVVATGAHSALERRYLIDVERAHGLPAAHRQVWTSAEDRVDMLLPEYHLVIELDGRLGHAGSGTFRDLHRDNGHLVRGLTSLRYGFGDIAGTPCQTARQVAQVVLQRGWEGPMVRCDRCQAMPIVW
ncbi:hypothetical protein [Mariniluteicoccus flavus]